jgi:triacylglycerol esterase/lipase EstA (alpha/beta hydrolase family)
MTHKTSIGLLTILLLVSNIVLAQYSYLSNSTSEVNQLLYTEVSMLAIDNLLVIEDASPGLSTDGRKPLLLIHGWSFEGKPGPPGHGYWEHFKNYLLNDPVLSAQFKPYYVKYWSNSVSVKELGTELMRQIEKEGLHEQKIALMCHSMGGLVARSYMNENAFTTGIAEGQKCGELVDVLITLGSPHHGSPMANNRARNVKFDFIHSIYVSLVEAAVFKESKYDEVNRSDLRWDNYDNLMDYNTYPDEKNDWLVSLNNFTQFDKKTVCYSAAVPGAFKTTPATLEEQYQLGAYLIEQGFKLPNDGIVPVKSAAFDGHVVKRIQHFNNYNHADIVRGKTNKNELFEPIKTDLLDVAPLKLTWPFYPMVQYVKHSQNKLIIWEAPSTVQWVNIYLSDNNGQDYQKIGSRVAASPGGFNWVVPKINSNQCLIKITNADFESEMSVTQQPFTIFYNNIVVTTPGSNDYMVRTRNNTISWTQVGLGSKVKITYRDTQSGYTQTIADYVPTSSGNNTYTWAPNPSITPSDKAGIQIELIGLFDEYGDTEVYTFNSDLFSYLGDREFKLMSPMANQFDIYGIKGEQLVIGSTYQIQWQAKGEIKHVEFFLCDSNLNVIAAIGNEQNIPKVQTDRTTNWVVPERYGDKFYLMARAGISPTNIIFEAYSENHFRINRQTKLINLSPLAAFPLQPCFETDHMNMASKWLFTLQKHTGEEFSDHWVFETSGNTFCLPSTLEYELEPSTSYSIIAVAYLGDTLRTFADRVEFTAIKTAPLAFSIIAPITGNTYENKQVNAQWNRAVGAKGYKIELMQGADLLWNKELANKSDTTISLDISGAKFYENIGLKVTAINPFGETTASTTFMKTFRNSIDQLAQQGGLSFVNYPNPFSQQTTFKFHLPVDDTKVSIALYDLTGRKIANIAEGSYQKGEHSIVWDRHNKQGIAKGVYLCRLEAGPHQAKLLVAIVDISVGY